MEIRTQQLNLDEPWYVRYWDWLTSFIRGDFGVAWRSGQSVNDLLVGAVSTSIQLVFAATCIALFSGVTIGLVSALRQYTTFDYAITFVSFVLFALPVFWVAVLLKQFVAIGFNDYLANPTMNWLAVIVLSVVFGLFWAGALATEFKRQAIIFGAATVTSIAVVSYAMLSGWVLDPQLGRDRRLPDRLRCGGGHHDDLRRSQQQAGLVLGSDHGGRRGGVVVPVQWVFYYVAMNWWWLLGLLLFAIGVACLIGWLWGGPDRGVSMRGAAVVAVIMSIVVYMDRVLQGWDVYMSASIINKRPIATIGSSTPNLGGDFWISQLDTWTHLLLPTIALVLISFAGYTRYQRGSMLEVMNQDYIRTARSKGMSERIVIMRHALRNALLPLASIVPVDFITLIGGAVITETIFNWAGMGRLFVTSLSNSEIDPIMAYVMITGALAMIANLVADFVYGLLDPRIRVNA